MNEFLKFKFKQTLSQMWKSLRFRRNFILITVFIVFCVLYVLYESSVSRPHSQSVSSHETHPQKRHHFNGSLFHISLENLIQRPVIINTSRVTTISAKELTTILESQKILSFQVIIDSISPYFSIHIIIYL